MTAAGGWGRASGKRGGSRVGLRGAGVVLAILFAIVVSYGVRCLLREAEWERISTQFELDAQQCVRAIELEVERHLEILRSIRAFYEGSEKVKNDEFRAFTASALRRHRSIETVQWAPVVGGKDRQDHEDAMHEMGAADYRIRERAAGGLVDAAERPEHLPAAFVEPLEGNEHLLGLDLATLPDFHATMIRACDSGRLTAHPRVRIDPGDAPDKFSALVVAAIYDLPTVSTIEDRRRHLEGYAVALIRLGPVVEEAMVGVASSNVELRLSDSGDNPLYRHAVEGKLAHPRFRHRDTISLADAELILGCAPPERYIRERRTLGPIWTSLAVFAFLGGGVAYLVLLTRHADRIEGLVAERTAIIREVSSLQHAILDGAPYTIVSTDPDGTIRTFNRTAERMLGYRADEVVGRATPGIFHKAGELQECATQLEAHGLPRAEGIHALLASAAAGNGDAREWTFVRRDGTEFPMSLSVTALRDESGAVTGFVGMGEDITKRKQAEAELVAAKTAAEEASQTKSRFLANMSHELRTPLNAIIGYSEMLEEDAVATGAHDVAGDLRRITEAAKHLLQLISDVLDLSKIEAGRVEIHNEPVALDRLIGEATGMVSQLVAQNGNTLEATCDPAIGTMVTDTTRVRQILYNLLSNAAKFTQNGAVRVAAVLEPGPEPVVVLTVEDTGIGMDAAQLERIFDPFAQADGSTTRKYGGTGLGLAICQEFCRLMGGSIQVTSEAGRGSTFTVRLPYHRGGQDAS